MKYYTGIGSRETPDDILKIFRKIGLALNIKGWILRSGGAEGADSWFELGAKIRKPEQIEIYLPWENFNGKSGDGYHIYESSPELEALSAEAWESRRNIKWNTLKNGVKALMRRNVNQVLGKDLKTPSNFVICWTKGGDNAQGGTAQALYLANKYSIPIINFGNGSVEDNIEQIKNLCL